MATALEELGAFGSGVTVGSLVLGTQLSKMARGGMYSMGMDIPQGARATPILSQNNIYQLGSLYVLPDGSTTKATPAGMLALNAQAAGSQHPFLQQGPSRTLTNSPVAGSGAFVGLAIGMTAFGAISSYNEGGGEALGRYMIEDVYANLYGNLQAERHMLVTEKNISMVKNAFGVAAESTQINVGDTVRGYNKILGSTLVGRALPVLTGYVGAQIGFGAGQAIGEGLSNMMFGSSYGMGLAGGILGARFGAQMGAAVGGSGLGVLGAMAIGGAMMSVAPVADMLKTGFTHTRNRGLDFAGDLATFNTNAAASMRQRAVQSMHKSHLNARSALGQEASFQHMNRDYFSHYRRF